MSTNVLFNSLDQSFKTPVGCLRHGGSMELRIKLWKNDAPSDVHVIMFEYCNYSNQRIINMDLEKMDETYSYFKAVITDLEINIYEYYFSFNCFGRTKYLKRNENSWEAFICTDPMHYNWQLTVYDVEKTHENMQNGIMYQIFPDRFFNNGKVKNLPANRIYRPWGETPYFTNDKICTDFFCGNLGGITDKLNYLQSLGISVLYLNPIWESHSNHRYDTANYEQVDPILGNMEDLKLLVEKAHSRNMIVILDTVLNHTGSDSVYFNKYNHYNVEGAYNSRHSLFYNWYYFHGNRDNYASWWGFDTLPKLNQNDSGFIDYFFAKNGVIDKWYSIGIDGLRLDVADELENSTLKKIHEASKRNRNSIVIIGEVWDDASNKCNYGRRMEYFLGKELTSTMNYPIRDAIVAYIRYGNSWCDNLYKTFIKVFIENYPREISLSLMNMLSDHDIVRAINKLAGKEVDANDREWQNNNNYLTRDELKVGKARIKLSFFLVYFLPGIPSLFYGDEIGLQGQKDPFCRACFPWNRIDKKLLRFFRKLGLLRKSQCDFLAEASFEIIEVSNELCIFTRKLGSKTLYILINRENHEVSISNYDFIKDFSNKHVLYAIGKNTNKEKLDAYGGLLIEENK